MNLEDVEKKLMDLPLLTKNQSISAPEFKQSIMFTVDSLRDLNSEMRHVLLSMNIKKITLLLKVTFRESVMMGIMQWMMLETVCMFMLESFK